MDNRIRPEALALGDVGARPARPSAQPAEQGPAATMDAVTLDGAAEAPTTMPRGVTAAAMATEAPAAGADVSSASGAGGPAIPVANFSETGDLLGSAPPTGGLELEWRPGPIAEAWEEAMRSGQMFTIELPPADPGLLQRLNDLIDSAPRVQRPDAFFGTLNPTGFDLDRDPVGVDLNRNFRVVTVGAPDRRDYEGVVSHLLKDLDDGGATAQRMIAFHEAVIMAGGTGEIAIDRPPSLRDLVAMARVVAVDGPENGVHNTFKTAADMVYASRCENAADRDKIVALAEQSLRSPVGGQEAHEPSTPFGKWLAENGPLVPTESLERHASELESALGAVKSVEMVGPAASGKTALLQAMAKYKDVPMRRWIMGRHTDLCDIVGQWRPADGGPKSFVFDDSRALVDGVRKGQWIVIEDIDSAPAHVQDALKPLRDGFGYVKVPRQLTGAEEDEIVNLGEGGRVFFVSTPQPYAGRMPLPERLSSHD